MVLKQKRWESKRYLAWVRCLPCVSCGAPADEAHHLIGLGLGGMGTKAPGWAVIPMCRGCHSTLHREPEEWDRQWLWLMKTLKEAFAENVLGVK